MAFKKGQIPVESFDTSDEAWYAITHQYANLLNSPRFKEAKKLGYKLTVVFSKKRYWVVVNPPGSTK